MTWPWALHMNEAINPFGDVVVQMTSLRWNAHALATNPLGLFDAPFFYPYAHSLAFSENLLGETLIALPFLLVTGNPALAANTNILLSYVLTGVFTYLLVRDLTGNRAAGVLSGVAFAFCQFRFMQMGHLHMLATQWFPFTLWALHRMGKAEWGKRNDWGAISVPGVRYIWWAAFGFIAMGLSSVYYIYFLALAVLLYMAWWLLFRDRSVPVAWGRLALHGGLALVVVGLVLGPVFWPYLQTNAELGFSRSIYEVQNWQAEWSFFGNVLQSNWLYGKVLAPAMASAGGERELFPGIVPCVLAVMGIARGRGRERFYYLALGLIALVLTFGLSGRIPGTTLEIPLPYAFLYDWVPGFKALRVPVRFAVLVDLSIYVLAGYGLGWVLGVLKRPAVQGRAANAPGIALATLLTALVLLEFVNPLDTTNRRDVMAMLANTESYGRLSEPENAGPVVELPMAGNQDDVWYTFFGTRHWQPLVNGFSSFVPPGTVYIKQALDHFPDPFSLSLLQGLEVRHILVHLWQFPADQQVALKAKLDETPQLSLVDKDGENYTYELAPDPWLRKMGEEVGSGTLWVGESRHGSMPVLDPLVYALGRLGLPPDRIGGNIDSGYRPIGSLPFGTAPDYALLPNLPGANDSPFGTEGMHLAGGNAVARLLKRDPSLLKSYDMTLPSAPRTDAGDLQLRVGDQSIDFGPGGSASGAGTRSVDLILLAFEPSRLSVKAGDNGEQVSTELTVPVGISHFSPPGAGTPYDITLSRQNGDARLLRVDLRDGSYDGESYDYSSLMPAVVSAQRDGGLLNSSFKVVPPLGGPDFTATVDVYLEPWGTHPNGHFGSWSVKVPADGGSHTYAFSLDPVAKTVTTTRDGAPEQTFAWVGPPSEGDFRASLSIAQGDKLISNIPLYSFTVKDGKLTAADTEPEKLTIIHPVGK